MNNEQTPAGYRTNAAGHLVPESQIKAVDLVRDELVCNMVEEAMLLQQGLAAFKAKYMAEITDFVDVSAAEHNVKFGGAKGNVSLLSYDGKFKVQRAIGEHRVFDERILAAKALLDQCIERWCADGANDNIRALVEHAFRVNKQGHIDVNEVLGLRQLSIDDEEWKAAMDALADSIQVTGTSSYLRLYKRDNNGKYQQFPLDISKL
ncbi:DUF3164 family protein [Agarivorans gilvus]|uniref:Sulfate transporter n=1 Tax=Agarivorans gilvus TaxID=680279 RepID=A0ABQ1HZK3_9ALTE|nr:DUF3164 family protein [Agarivorans gilvus]GGA95972.1 sulfate transporter [Agarivorans gilvus]